MNIIAKRAIQGLDYWWPNRASDPRYTTLLDDIAPLIAYHWDSADHPERKSNLYLDILAVHPEGQGKGVGRELVQWGIDESKKERIPSSVIAAHEKDKFYEKFGFREVGRANVGKMGEAGIRGGSIMFTGAE